MVLEAAYELPDNFSGLPSGDASGGIATVDIDLLQLVMKSTICLRTYRLVQIMMLVLECP